MGAHIHIAIPMTGVCARGRGGAMRRAQKITAANSRAGRPPTRPLPCGARGMRVRPLLWKNSVADRREARGGGGAFFSVWNRARPVPDRVRWRAKRSAAPRGCPPSPWESPPGLSRPDSPKPHGPRGHEGGQRGRVESRWVKRWLAGGLRGGWSEPWAGWEGVTPVGHAVNAKWARPSNGRARGAGRRFVARDV